jgi:hypothetical protein
MIRRLSSAVMALALAIGIMAVVPGHAAAYSCYGSSCDGRNPVQYGCNLDGVTAETVPILTNGSYGTQVGWFQLWYSTNCGAAWVGIGNTRTVTTTQATGIYRSNGGPYYDPFTIPTYCPTQCKDTVGPGKTSFGMMLSRSDNSYYIYRGYICTTSSCTSRWWSQAIG